MPINAAVAEPHRFQDWLTLRDAGVVRQQRDFSCGLAALATILKIQFGYSVTEQQLLHELLGTTHVPAHAISRAASKQLLTPAEDLAHTGVSFAALAELAGERSIHAIGLSVNLETLRKLRQPAIVALSVNTREHFSVIRRIDEAGNVWLADPTWGNRRLAAWQFAPLFLSDGASDIAAATQGRLLLLQSSRQLEHLDYSSQRVSARDGSDLPLNRWRISIPPSMSRFR